MQAGTYPKGIVAKLLKLQRGKCACCRMPLGADYHLDHIQPLALGGANADWNVQLLRSKCNLEQVRAPSHRLHAIKRIFTVNHFQLVVTKRIADHQAAEQARMDAERERIRAEEAAKLQREAREAEARAERERQEAMRQQVLQAERDAQAGIADGSAPPKFCPPRCWTIRLVWSPTSKTMSWLALMPTRRSAQQNARLQALPSAASKVNSRALLAKRVTTARRSALATKPRCSPQRSAPAHQRSSWARLPSAWGSP